MIPDHLIDKAAQAIVTGMGGESLLTDMHPEDAAYARADARAALEAVAADIWDEGWISRHDAGEMHTVTPNPYRIEHT